jgi:hypothetical protein
MEANIRSAHGHIRWCLPEADIALVAVRNSNTTPCRIFSLSTEPFGKRPFLLVPDGVSGAALLE